MEQDHSARLIVLTGGPGSGKSTLIEALAARGFSSMPEAGRAIIRDQLAIGGEALPWSDRFAFAELMLSWEMRSYRHAQTLEGIVFFDRGIPDVQGYLRLIGQPVPPHVEAAARIFRYHQRVFVAPPWPQIFLNDAERRQSFEEARATHDVMVQTYSELGYDLISLPLAGIEQRIQFILNALA